MCVCFLLLFRFFANSSQSGYPVQWQTLCLLCVTTFSLCYHHQIEWLSCRIANTLSPFRGHIFAFLLPPARVGVLSNCEHFVSFEEPQHSHIFRPHGGEIFHCDDHVLVFAKSNAVISFPHPHQTCTHTSPTWWPSEWYPWNIPVHSSRLPGPTVFVTLLSGRLLKTYFAIKNVATQERVKRKEDDDRMKSRTRRK